LTEAKVATELPTFDLAEIFVSDRFTAVLARDGGHYRNYIMASNTVVN
jgi:hypothetical protein